MSLAILFLSVEILLPALLGQQLHAGEYNIYFKTAPMAQSLMPQGDPADLSLLITGNDGRPLERGTVTIRLEAPRPGVLFSTDVPMVEGTLLSEMQLPLRQGRVNWKYQFPIRGDYLLHVEVLADGGMRAAKSFQITIREDRHKWIVLGGFSLALVLLGFVAGRVFTAPNAMALLLTLALAMATASSELSAAEALGGADAAGLEIEPATVGRPSLVRWTLAESGVGGGAIAALTLTITQLEDNHTVFALQRVAVGGEFALRFQFTDGSPHRVTAIAEVAGRAPIESEKIISVTAVEPPLRRMIPTLVFFVMLIVFGLAFGRLSKRH